MLDHKPGIGFSLSFFGGVGLLWMDLVVLWIGLSSWVLGLVLSKSIHIAFPFFGLGRWGR